MSMQRHHRPSMRIVMLAALAILTAACSPITSVEGTAPMPVVSTFSVVESSPAQVDHVEVEIGQGSPVPVTLTVDGQWPACDQLAQISQRIDGQTIEVSVQTAAQAGASCRPDTVPFRVAIPLNAVPLQAGTYIVQVNGVSASFDWPAPAH